MKRLVAMAALVALAAPVTAQQVKVDPALPFYQKTSGVSGNINSVGSDTMNNLMTLWAEAFLKMYPNVKVQVEGKGSSTAPPALIAGTSQFGPMSRAMRGTEVDQFEAKYGYKPTQLRTSYDALAVYVNKDNPIERLTLQQVDAIFSKTRRCGAQAAIEDWSQTGIGGMFAGRRISLYGRNSASGTYGYFKEHALCGGDYRDDVKEQPGSASVVQGVTEDTFAIGYSGIGYKTSSVKALDLAAKEGMPFAKAEAADVYGGKYPLARFLMIYVNQAPGRPLDPLVKEFVRMVLSKEGQEVVVKDGYLPLTKTIFDQEHAKLEK